LVRTLGIVKAPRIIRVDPERPDAGVLADAAKALREGGLVAFPTETVYGLGGRALDAASIARIFAAKGRPATHPLIAHVDSFGGLEALARRVPGSARAFAEAFWPGGLTLVVPRSASIPSELTGGTDTVAVRMPAHPVALALVRALGEPIAAPSANRYQGISPTRAEHVVRSLGARVDIVLDGGSALAGIESTVLDLTGAVPTVLRPGAISIDELRRIDPNVTLASASVAPEAPRASPGMDARHYAPNATLHVEATRSLAVARARTLVGQGLAVAILLRGEVPRGDENTSLEKVFVRVLPDDPAAFAHGFYSELHDFEAASVDAIVLVAVPRDDAWLAVADRIRRASSPAA